MIDRSHPSGLPPDPNEPRFSREELDSIKFDDPDIDAELDAEETARDAELRRLGASDDAIARVRGRTGADAAPKQTLADVERELEELRELRKTHRQRYWHPDTQAKEAKLYATLEELKGEAPNAEDASPEDATAEQTDALPESLRKEWARMPDGVEGALAAIRTRTTMALDGLDEEAGADLRASFDRLDDESQQAIAASLAEDTRHPPATVAEVQEFVQDTEYGQELVTLWGEKSAPAMLGRAKREASILWGSLTEKSKLDVERWVSQRPREHKIAIIKALAARARRRL